MRKQITAIDLAELVVGLLVKPELLGELDSQERYQNFMLDIGRVVADHCGGEANWINAGRNSRHKDDYDPELLSVSPNDSIPSLCKNIWSYHDPSGWDDDYLDCDSIEGGEPLTAEHIAKVRGQLQGLLVNKALFQGEQANLSLEIVDWCSKESEALEHKGDDRPYSVEVQLGNQSFFEIREKDGESCIGLMIKINKGVPAIHIDTDGEETLLHIHKAQGGLVLTPEDQYYHFVPAKPDRHAYQSRNAVLIR